MKCGIDKEMRYIAKPITTTSKMLTPVCAQLVTGRGTEA
jgi:hypothetical protein